MKGEIFTNRHGTSAEVIRYINYKSVVVKFLDKVGYVGRYRLGHLKEGNFKNPYDKNIFGVGYFGEGKKLTKSTRSYYGIWKGMLARCYDSGCTSYANYGLRGVYVDERWHNFQTFLIWTSNQPRLEGWHLDKDLLSTGSKFYSPETCCFLPFEVNMAFTNLEVREDKALGVEKISEYGYRVRVGTGDSRKVNTVGTFPSIVEAEEAYRGAKEAYIHHLAEKWKYYIDNRAYGALKSWRLP